MSAAIALEPATLHVEPGGEASLTLTIRNTGTVVDEFAIEVVGDARAWATAEPATVSLFPAAQGTTVITFRPPRVSSTRAGTTTFGVMARSHENPSDTVVEEGVLEVGGFLAMAAELIPRTSHGSRGGRHDIAIDNRGNVRLDAQLAGLDPDRRVRLDLDPAMLPVEPGTAAFGHVVVKPVRRFWRGPARTVPFQVTVKGDTSDPNPFLLDGTYVQESILPWWFARALMALVALVVAGVLLWLFVLQPQIRSTAADTLEEFGFSPKPGSVAAGGSPPPDGASPAPSSALDVTPPPDGGRVLTDGRIDTGTSVTPTAGTLFITDLVFSNPTGASGELTLQRTTGAGTAPLLVLELENFRDLDLHFVTPISLRAGETLALVANCTAGAAAPAAACSPALFYAGYLEAP